MARACRRKDSTFETSQVKSVFLYGKPNKVKLNLLSCMQQKFCELANENIRIIFFRKDPTGNDRLRNMKKKILHLRYSFRHTLSYIIYSNLKNFLDRKYGLMNYAIEYCPVCKKREVVYTTGQTKCSNCSTLITPCDACLNCTDICPYKSGEIHNSPSILERQIIHFI